MEDWTILEAGEPVDVVYTDFRRPSILYPIAVCLASCIRGRLHKWLEAFLTGRRQRVVVNGTFSGWSEVTSGIPQGSVLGPVMFTLYVND